MANFNIDVHPLTITEEWHRNEEGHYDGTYFVFRLFGESIEETTPEKYNMELSQYSEYYLWGARQKFNEFLAEGFKEYLKAHDIRLEDL